ncbi:MAG: hypothetical protein IPK83_08330 [Planctomycetes bacterium]|nr:hypothetical protein [Planctomycetota bacterium]
MPMAFRVGMLPSKANARFQPDTHSQHRVTYQIAASATALWHRRHAGEQSSPSCAMPTAFRVGMLPSKANARFQPDTHSQHRVIYQIAASATALWHRRHAGEQSSPSSAM